MHCVRDFDPADPNEDEYFGIDFINDLPTDESLVSASVALTLKLGDDPDPAGHLVGGPIIMEDTIVSQRIRNLQPGNVYTLRALAVSNVSGSIVSLWANIACEPVF
jgi:hypothetical protein